MLIARLWKYRLSSFLSLISIILAFMVTLFMWDYSEALQQQSNLAADTSGVVGLPTSMNSKVKTDKDLLSALLSVKPGTTILISPGLYTQGIYLKDTHGTHDLPIVIAGSDPDNQPIFMGQGEGIKMSSCSYIKFSNLTFQGFTKNGINIDDGGNLETPTHHIILDNITVLDIGPTGNRDALKMSGVDHFIISNSMFKGWGGSGVDMVGCHNGVVENCQFIGVDGYRTANGVQIKGGSRNILVQSSYFENAGERVVHIGGSTGKQYFRPQGTSYEAKDVTVAGNTIAGGEAQIAWITAQKSHVHHNLFYFPGKWVGRILQETKDPMFEPSQEGLFENNMVVTDDRVRTFFNVGRGTQPSSFVFRANSWFNPKGSFAPSLPVPEKDGVYDLDPGIIQNDDGRLLASSSDPRIKNVGPWDYTPWVAEDDFGDITLNRIITPAPEPPSTSKASLILMVIVAVIVLPVLAYFGYRTFRPVRR